MAFFWLDFHSFVMISSSIYCWLHKFTLGSISHRIFSTHIHHNGFGILHLCYTFICQMPNCIIFFSLCHLAESHIRWFLPRLVCIQCYLYRCIHSLFFPKSPTSCSVWYQPTAFLSSRKMKCSTNQYLCWKRVLWHFP